MALAPLTLQADGRHSDITALRRALADLGVTAPHTGQPLSEPMLLGIGGGIGGGYWLFEFTGAPKALVIGARHRWHQLHLFMGGLCERLGQPVTIRETSGERAAGKHLTAVLEAGRQPLVWVDQAALPYTCIGSQWERFWIHVVGVRGLDSESGDVLVDDRTAEPWRVSRDRFEQTRTSIAYNKHRLIVPEPRPAPLTLDELRTATLAGIRVCLDELLHPPIKNFGLPAFTKMADLLTHKKNKKGWPQVFKEPAELLRALGGIHHSIETNGTGGGAFRAPYAEFLDEAAEVLQRPALTEAAAAYRQVGEQWSALAAAALPDAEPLLRRSRELAREKDHLFQHEGPRALPRLEEIAAESAAIEEQAAAGLALTPAEIDDLLTDLRARLLAIVAAEEAAATQLGAAIEGAG